MDCSLEPCVCSAVPYRSSSGRISGKGLWGGPCFYGLGMGRHSGEPLPPDCCAVMPSATPVRMVFPMGKKPALESDTTHFSMVAFLDPTLVKNGILD